MTETLQILLVEDNPDDELLICRELRKGGMRLETHRVENRREFLSALEQRRWNLVISDYLLPEFSGMEALALLRERDSELPFVLVSGTIGEEIAVESIKGGANDYLLKQNLVRLAPAVKRAIQEAENRRERHVAEQALLENQQRLALIVNTVSDALAFLSKSPTGDWIYSDINRAFGRGVERAGFSSDSSRILGRPATELEKRALANDPDSARWIHEQRHEAERLRTRIRLERELKFPGGTFVIEFTFLPNFAVDGRCQHMLMVARDVTELRRAEERDKNYRNQRIQAQKMESLGTLSGGIAHDFNNLLTGILGYAELLQKEACGEKADYYTRQIIQASQRAQEVTRQILIFSRRQSATRRPVAINEVAREVFTFVNVSLPRTIETVVDLPQPGPWALADAAQAHQVILNLCTNAVQAMGESGRLTISSKEVALDEMFCQGRRISPGRYARISVSDTGVGMSAEIQERIFEPFFTTKTAGKGTGLGLSVVHSIVQEHEGAVVVTSSPGQGATFDVYLPVTTSPASLTVSENRICRGAGQRILCLDDDEAVVQLTKLMLVELKYTPACFCDPTKALSAFNQNPKAFDLIITDYRMPTSSGVAFAKAIRQRHPNIPILLFTGDIVQSDLDSFHGLSKTALLNKPFTLAQLGSALANMLER